MPQATVTTTTTTITLPDDAGACTYSHLFAGVVPTTTLEAVNIILAGLGEAPINSLDDPLTSDVAVAAAVLSEVSKELQLEGWAWNTQDDYPLRVNVHNQEIDLPPSLIRVHFPRPDDRELVIRGRRLFDRKNHSFTFAPGTTIRATITELLPFDDLPEAARRYVALRAMRITQERVVGSSTLSQFHQQDEYRARALLLREERMLDRPNMLTGTLPPTGTSAVMDVLRR